MSLALVRHHTCKLVLLRLTISFPIRKAIALASSIRPALMSLFFLRNCALMNGVANSGSLEDRYHSFGIKSLK